MRLGQWFPKDLGSGSLYFHVKWCCRAWLFNQPPAASFGLCIQKNALQHLFNIYIILINFVGSGYNIPYSNTLHLQRGCWAEEFLRQDDRFKWHQQQIWAKGRAGYCRVSVGIGWDRPIHWSKFKVKVRFIILNLYHFGCDSGKVSCEVLLTLCYAVSSCYLFQCWCFASVHVNAIPCPSTFGFCFAWSLPMDLSCNRLRLQWKQAKHSKAWVECHMAVEAKDIWTRISLRTTLWSDYSGSMMGTGCQWDLSRINMNQIL